MFRFFWIILYLIMASNKSRTLLIFLCSTPRVSNSFWIKAKNSSSGPDLTPPSDQFWPASLMFDAPVLNYDFTTVLA